MSTGKAATIGYKYYLGMHMVLCHGPIDEVSAILVDQKVAWSGSATGGAITVDAAGLFGGDSREGGVSGVVDICMGGVAQARNTYLQGQLGTAIPAYRGVVSAVLNQVYVGLNPYLKLWSFVAKRTNVRHSGGEQWYVAKAAIGTDMNPAHIIRECLTDPNWGMGYAEADMDDAAFTVAANQLYTEGLGISILWDKSTAIDSFISTVLKHIDAALYVSRTTGKFVLALARGGYDVGTLMVLDENCVSKVTDFKRASLGELTNSVTVVFWDASTRKDNSVTERDVALIAQQGATITQTFQYPGLTNGTNAAKVAARDLRTLATPLASCVIYATRKAASLNVGGVFVFSWARYGVVSMVMRITNIELGALDNNIVKITAIEDVFGLAAAVYTAPPASGWVNPVQAPTACPYHAVTEAPYWELAQRLGDTAAQALDSNSCYVQATGVRPSPAAINAKVYTDPENDTVYEESGTVDFCPGTALSAAVGYTDTTLPIGGGSDLDTVRLGSYALLDSEFVIVTAITSTYLTVGRGTLDTVPATHASGTRIFFVDDYAEGDNLEYGTGETARIKLLPVTGLGPLAVASAPVQTVTMVQRQYRPYPPGKFKINGEYYPPVIDGDAATAFVIDWAHRDRLQQTATLVDYTAASIGPETGTTYTLRIYNEADTLADVISSLTTTTYTYPTATEEANSGVGRRNGRMRIELESLRDAVTSLQKHNFTVLRDGYGFNYGLFYGGM